MDKNEAKLLLQACRPNGQDAALSVFAEALALVERDPELKAWWEAQQAFDQKISAKLKEVPVPSNLRATILAGRKIEELTPRFQVPTWLAIAAMVVILCVAGVGVVHHGMGGTEHLSSDGYKTGAIAFLGDNGPSLGTTSPDHDKLVAWLKERNAPVGTIPASMNAMPSVGCQTFPVQGHSVSLICFSMADGGIVHLFVIDRDALADPPSSTGPEYKQMGRWATASWSDGQKSYMLATDAGVNMLKQLL